MELDGLKTEFLGKNIMYFLSIDSTQKKIKTIRNPENGTIVIAENQTEGIGTHGRKWYTGAGKNIAMSFVLLPNCSIEKIENITLEIAECLVKILNLKTGLLFEINEPNDIFYNGKKVAGVLTEVICSGKNVKKLYIGIGLNVNQDNFPGNLSELATSLKEICGKEFEREDIICNFLNEFEKKYKKIIY